MKKLIILLLFTCSLFGQFKFQRSLDDRYTVLHIRGNGQAGSTTIPDVGYYGNTITAYGGAVISSTQKKFGNTSIYFDGTDDYLSVPASSLWDFKNNNFTIEGYFFHTSFVNSGCHFFAKRGKTTNYSFMIFYYSGAVKFYYTADGSSINTITYTYTPPLNTWYHLCFVRNGNSLSMFVNGVQIGTSNLNVSIYNSSVNLLIGWDTYNPYPLSGYAQDIRISKCARWTSNFTPPNKPY